MFSLTQTMGSTPIAVPSLPDETAERTVRPKALETNLAGGGIDIIAAAAIESPALSIFAGFGLFLWRQSILGPVKEIALQFGANAGGRQGAGQRVTFDRFAQLGESLGGAGEEAGRNPAQLH